MAGRLNEKEILTDSECLEAEAGESGYEWFYKRF